MSYHFTRITEAEAREVLSWRYPEIGTVYDPNPGDFELDVAALLLPEYHYHAVHDHTGALVGFCCFGPDAQVPGGDYAVPALDIGLGMHPSRLGRGLSHGFLQAILDFGRGQFDPDLFRATVADFNVRSQGMLVRAGFVIVQRFRTDSSGPVEFLVLLRTADGQKPADGAESINF